MSSPYRAEHRAQVTPAVPPVESEYAAAEYSDQLLSESLEHGFAIAYVACAARKLPARTKR